MLLRARPGTGASRAAAERVAAWTDRAPPGRVLVFFHGEGVRHAAERVAAADWRRLAGWHGVDLAVCDGSWRRRFEVDHPAEPFERSTLVAFWRHALEAAEVCCHGAGHAG